jgi:hypothetical protein
MRDLESDHRDSDGTIGFKASPELIAQAEAAARAEGMSRAAVARRALMRDLERRRASQTGEAA